MLNNEHLPIITLTQLVSIENVFLGSVTGTLWTALSSQFYWQALVMITLKMQWTFNAALALPIFDKRFLCKIHHWNWYHSFMLRLTCNFHMMRSFFKIPLTTLPSQMRTSERNISSYVCNVGTIEVSSSLYLTLSAHLNGPAVYWFCASAPLFCLPVHILSRPPASITAHCDCAQNAICLPFSNKTRIIDYRIE